MTITYNALATTSEIWYYVFPAKKSNDSDYLKIMSGRSRRQIHTDVRRPEIQKMQVSTGRSIEKEPSSSRMQSRQCRGGGRESNNCSIASSGCFCGDPERSFFFCTQFSNWQSVFYESIFSSHFTIIIDKCTWSKSFSHCSSSSLKGQERLVGRPKK
jgi:hypothetical protein